MLRVCTYDSSNLVLLEFIERNSVAGHYVTLDQSVCECLKNAEISGAQNSKVFNVWIQQLNPITLIAGNVELTNMQLKPEALNALKLPIKVKAGFLGSVKLKVCYPWDLLLFEGKIPRICEDPKSKHYIKAQDLRKHLHCVGKALRLCTSISGGIYLQSFASAFVCWVTFVLFVDF